jgi:hypothetical protein
LTPLGEDHNLASVCATIGACVGVAMPIGAWDKASVHDPINSKEANN